MKSSAVEIKRVAAQEKTADEIEQIKAAIEVMQKMVGEIYAAVVKDENTQAPAKGKKAA